MSAVMFAASIARSAPQTDQVEFEADEATVDPATQSLSLDGHVIVTCGQTVLEADRLRLQASDGGASIWGPAELSLCRCALAPLRLSFERARVEARGDVIVTHPRLIIGDTPVLALPAFWLRSADQAGLLPPRLAWRGDGGLLLGPGFHVPWHESDGAPAWMDLYVSGYSRGGFEVEPSIVTQSSSSKVRFDRTDGDLARVESTGSTQGRAGGGVAWSADVSRGSRARSGLIALDEAAQRFDVVAARADVRSIPGALIGAGFEGIGPRGDGELAWGPVLTVDTGGGLGRLGAWWAGGSSRVFAEPDSDTSQLSSARTGLEVSPWLGPLAMTIGAAATAVGWVAPDETGSDLTAWSSSRLGLPLSRRFSSGLVHRVEPQLLATLVRSRSDDSARIAAGRPAVLSDGTRWVASAGASTAIARPGEPHGLAVDASAGGTGEVGHDAAALMRGELVASARPFSLRARGAVVRDGDRLGGIVLARATLGGARTFALMGDVATRTRVDPSAARALLPYDVSWNGADGLDCPGTSLALGAGVPLIGGVRAESVGHWDVGAKRVLSTGGGLAYEHPCGCLSARGWVSRRVGREGIDAWATLDLTPR